jgi:uncharacterized protein YycO
MPPKVYIPKGNKPNIPTYNPRSKTSFGEDYITSQYDVGIPYGKSKDEYRTERQTFWDSVGNATTRGVSGAASAIGETIGALGDWSGIYNRITGQEDNYSNFLTEGADYLRSGTEQSLPEYGSTKFGDKGWWMNGYSSVLETAGYFAVGGAVGEVFGLAGRAIGMAARPVQITQGIGTAITMNYAEGVQIAHQSYQNMLSQGVPKEIASEKASKLIDANRINILFELPQYLSMFRVGGAFNYTRQFKDIDKGWGRALMNVAGQGTAEGSEEVLQGYMQSEVEREARLENANKILQDPSSTSSQKESAKKTLASENVGSSVTSRFLNYVTSEEGLTEAIFGAFGGMMFEGMANVRENLRKKGKSEQEQESAARELIASNPATVNNLLKKNDEVDKALDEAIQKGDVLERDRLVRQKFINIASMNAQRGTYAQFMRTIEGLSTMSDEEIQEFGVDKDYLRKQAPKMVEDAKFIESIYNDTLKNFNDLPAQTPEELDSKSKIISSALNMKWNYKEFTDFKNKATEGKNRLYTEHVASDERHIVELKHQLQAYENLSKDKVANELTNATEKIKNLKQVLRDEVKLYNDINGTKRGLSYFNNPLADEAGVQLTESEIAYEANRETVKNQYNDLVKNKQSFFEEVTKETEKQVEKAAENKQTAQQEAEILKKKQEQEGIVARAKFKELFNAVQENSTNPEVLNELKARIDQEPTDASFTATDKKDLNRTIDSYLNPTQEVMEDDGNPSLDDLARSLGVMNVESTQEVHDKNSDFTGEEAYNPIPSQQLERETQEFEKELQDQDEDFRKPNPGANTQALAINLMEFKVSSGGRYIHSGEVNPTANVNMFNPDFIKAGDKLVIFVDTTYETYDENKENVSEIPLAVVRQEDYDKGDRIPIAYIHTPKWYENNETIPEENRGDLAEENRLMRNTIFQTKNEKGEFIPHITTIIDKSNGVITKSDKEHSIFEVSEDPKLIVAKTSETFVGMTEEEEKTIQLTHPMQDKEGNPLIGVPFLLVKSPSGKWFPKFVKTHKLNETTQNTQIGTTIYQIFKEFYSLGESQALKEAGIDNLMDVAEQIKKFVYFGDKTQNLDQRKLFFVQDGIVNITGKTFDFNKEVPLEPFLKAIGELYTTVNTKHLSTKENSKFNYLTWKDGKFIKTYTPYKKFLDNMEFISINSRPNHGTIFGNYVTKIDNNIKPIAQTVEEKPIEPVIPSEITEEKVAKEPQKAYIDKSKKSPFKKATAKKQISDEEAAKRKKNCD